MFKWLKRNILERPQIPITSQAIDQYFSGVPSSAGVSVNKQTVLGSAATWRAVNLISSSIARLPCRVYKRRGEGKVKDEWHPAFYLLNKRPNNDQTAYIFFQTLQAHCLLHGNGYAYVFRNDSATPIELAILDPTTTTAVRENGQLLYVTSINGEDRKLLPENVLHVKGLGFDGLSGYSVIDILRDTFGHDLALLRYGNTYFKHGSALNVVVEMPGTFRDAEAVKRFRESWGSIHSGLDNAHKVAILENGAKVNRLVASNEEAQFLQSREFDLKALANVFGLPPSYLGSNYNTSYASLEAENKAFLNHSLGGWLAMWEAELDSKLLTEVQKIRDSHFIEFERKAFESSDLATTVQALATQIASGMLTINEARSILNMPAVEGGDKIKTQQPQQAPQAPQQAPEQPQPQDDTQAEQVAKSLARANVARLIARLGKDVEAKHTDLVARHLNVAVESLPTFNREAIADWLSNLQAEIKAVLPEQRRAIIEGQDPNKLAEQFYGRL